MRQIRTGIVYQNTFPPKTGISARGAVLCCPGNRYIVNMEESIAAMKLRQMISKRGLIGLLVLCILICVVNVAGAQAETAAAEQSADVQSDLENRFNDVPTLEYNGVTYRLKNRLTSVLILGTALETEGAEIGVPRAEFVAMLVVDDNARTITPIQIDCLAPVSVEGMEAAETMRTLFSRNEDQKASADILRQGMNGLMSEEILEHYLTLDIDSLESYDAVSAPEENETPKAVMKRRLKALLAQAESASSDELNDMFVSMSDHILTDMKTGAIMKIIDKTDRYEVTDSVYVPGSYVLENEQEVFDVDEAGFLDIIVNTFYEEKIW